MDDWAAQKARDIFWPGATTTGVAQALRDERERCAKIADAKRDHWSSAAGFGGYSAAARIIADEIRNQ